MIEIRRMAYLVMLAHCQQAYPLEACGFLGGRHGQAFVVTVVENRLRSPVAFEMEPRQQLEGMLHLEESGLEMVAAYHSHPQGPVGPSASDMAQAYYPALPQFIISLKKRADPSVRAFLLKPDKIEAVNWRLV